MVDYTDRSRKSHLARSGNSSCPLKKFILPARENIVHDEEHSRVSFTVMEKRMTQMLRFKVKTTPNKTTVRKMLHALFLQRFNGFILHGTFVVCQEIYIIFSKIKFFPLEYRYCFVVIASALPETASIYTAESCSNESVFLFFSTKSEQTAIQQSHIINPLLTSFARSVLPSVFIAQTSLLRRSVCTKTSGNTFPYRPRTRG